MLANLVGTSVYEYFAYGIALGFAAGIAPGPLLVLVISETLKGNRKNGVMIAIAPLITDLPIVFISIFLLSHFSGSDFILGILSITGGLFLIYMAIQNLKFTDYHKHQDPKYKKSILFGAITNALSPHPYIFWFSIGAPTYVRAMEHSTLSSICFVAGFYLLLVGSKIIVAVISERVGGFIKSATYLIVMRFMGVVLFLLSFLLLYEGIIMLYNFIKYN